MPEVTKRGLRQMLAQGDMPTLIEALLEITEQETLRELQGEVTLLSSKYHELDQASRAGTVFQSDRSVQASQLKSALLAVVEQLPEGQSFPLSFDPEERTQGSPGAPFAARRRRLLWPAVLTGFALLLAVFHYWPEQAADKEADTTANVRYPPHAAGQDTTMPPKENPQVGNTGNSPSQQADGTTRTAKEPASVALQGFVVDAGSEAPLAGVLVRCADGRTAISGSDGAFSFSFPDTREARKEGIRLFFSRDGYQGHDDYYYLNQGTHRIKLIKQ